MIGDKDYMLAKIRDCLPNGWFADGSPIATAVLGGLADGLAGAYQTLAIVKAGTRRATTTGWLLDVDAFGFFGSQFLRRQNESDDSWRPRYLKEIFRKRVTRPAIIGALTDLTGRTPILYEPWNPGDTGGYGITSSLAYGGGRPNAPRVTGYDIAGGSYGGPGSFAYVKPSAAGGSAKAVGFYGSLQYPFQIFITAFRPQPKGLPNVMGYGIGPGGYGGQGSLVYADVSQYASSVPDSEIYSTVARNVAAGITAWVTIKS